MEMSRKGKLGQNNQPLPKIIFCVLSRPILQISAHNYEVSIPRS